LRSEGRRSDPAKFHEQAIASHSGGKVESPLFAHVNYLDDDELALLADSGASVVYCPGSSAFFGRSGHRYADMLAAGINVAIGTDSLASNDSLDMLSEMRRLKRQGQVDNHTTLRMATLNGAIALGREDQLGSLEPGKFADWIAVQLPQINGDCPYLRDVLETILTKPCKVVQTVIGGRIECQA
jgi:cytosine/adenosine deaminase-related metal-dependent hydrolase